MPIGVIVALVVAVVLGCVKYFDWSNANVSNSNNDWPSINYYYSPIFDSANDASINVLRENNQEANVSNSNNDWPSINYYYSPIFDSANDSSINVLRENNQEANVSNSNNDWPSINYYYSPIFDSANDANVLRENKF